MFRSTRTRAKTGMFISPTAPMWRSARRAPACAGWAATASSAQGMNACAPCRKDVTMYAAVMPSRHRRNLPRGSKVYTRTPCQAVPFRYCFAHDVDGFFQLTQRLVHACEALRTCSMHPCDVNSMAWSALTARGRFQ